MWRTFDPENCRCDCSSAKLRPWTTHLSQEKEIQCLKVHNSGLCDHTRLNSCLRDYKPSFCLFQSTSSLTFCWLHKAKRWACGRDYDPKHLVAKYLQIYSLTWVGNWMCHVLGRAQVAVLLFIGWIFLCAYLLPHCFNVRNKNIIQESVVEVKHYSIWVFFFITFYLKCYRHLITSHLFTLVWKLNALKSSTCGWHGPCGGNYWELLELWRDKGYWNCDPEGDFLLKRDLCLCFLASGIFKVNNSLFVNFLLQSCYSFYSRERLTWKLPKQNRLGLVKIEQVNFSSLHSVVSEIFSG